MNFFWSNVDDVIEGRILLERNAPKATVAFGAYLFVAVHQSDYNKTTSAEKGDTFLLLYAREISILAFYSYQKTIYIGHTVQ